MYNHYQVYDSPALYVQIIVYKHAWLSFPIENWKVPGQQARVWSSCPRNTWSTGTCMILMLRHYLVNRHVYDPHAHAIPGQQARVWSPCPRITWSTGTYMILMLRHYLVNRNVYDPHAQAIPGQQARVWSSCPRITWSTGTCMILMPSISAALSNAACAVTAHRISGYSFPRWKFYFILSVTVRLGRELPLAFMKRLKGQCHKMDSLQNIYVISIHNSHSQCTVQHVGM